MIIFRQSDISQPLHEAVEIEVRTRPRAHVWLHRGVKSMRLRYRVPRAITVIGKGGKGYGPFLYGVRVRPDGVTFGHEHLITNTKRMRTMGLPGSEVNFAVPKGTVFKDLSGSADEVAAHFTLDVRDLPPEELEALRATLDDLVGLNAWLREQ